MDDDLPGDVCCASDTDGIDELELEKGLVLETLRAGHPEETARFIYHQMYAPVQSGTVSGDDSHAS